MPNSKFLKNVSYLISGGMIGSAFSLLITPIISRIFEPSQFGIASLFLSIASILGPILSLKYERAIILCSSENEANQVFFVSIACAFCSTLLLFLILAAHSYTPFLPFEKLGLWIYLVPLFAFILSLNFIFEAQLIRNKRFSDLASASLVDPISLGSSRLAFGYLLGGAVWPLISSFFIGALLKMLLLIKNSYQGVYESIKHFKIGSARIILLKYRDFPIYNAPAVLVNRIATDLPLLVFGALYAPEIVGFYAIAMRLIRTPVTICANAVRKVYNQKLVEEKKAGKPLRLSLIKLAGLCFITGAPPFLALFILGEETLTLLLGSKWQQAGIYSEILTPWLFSLWITTPCSVIVEVLRKQSTWLLVQITHILTRAAVFIYGYYANLDIIDILQLYVIVCLFGSLLALITMYYLASQHDRSHS